MISTHCSECSIFSKPELGVRKISNSTWLICIIQREYSSHISLCIFNDFSTVQTHAEEKFFNYWSRRPKRIFPDLESNEIERGKCDLVWYTLRSPCDVCTRLIQINQSLYRTLTILTASIYQQESETKNTQARNRIMKLRSLKGVKVEPMSPKEMNHFTRGRLGHKLFAYDKCPEQSFRDFDLSVSYRVSSFCHLPTAAIKDQFAEDIEGAEFETLDHLTFEKPKYLSLSTPDVAEEELVHTPLPSSPSKRIHSRSEIPSIMQKKKKEKSTDDLKD